MVSDDKNFHQLRKEIDERMPLGIPSTDSGIEIELLKQIFTPEEAEVAIHLSALPESLKKIHKRVTKAGINISIIELEKMLDGLKAKGSIMTDMEGFIFPKPKHYNLAQILVGMYEFHVDHLTKELGEVYEKYLKETYYKELIPKDRPAQLHTIPIETSLTPEHYVSNYDNIRKIIDKKKGPFWVVNCVCRENYDVIEDPCKASDIRHCCVMFKEISFGLDSKEEVSKEEMFDLINKWEKAGFVLQPENSRNPRFMCVCCGCCCSILVSAKQYPKPAEYYNSNFYAKSNLELCNGCETCISRCKMEAITLQDEKAVVNLDRCIGCGNCVPYCGQKAMTLVKKKKVKKPPRNTLMLYTKIMTKKRGLRGMILLAKNKILGKKT